jgi:hypothetical protein
MLFPFVIFLIVKILNYDFSPVLENEIEKCLEEIKNPDFVEDTLFCLERFRFLLHNESYLMEFIKLDGVEVVGDCMIRMFDEEFFKSISKSVLKIVFESNCGNEDIKAHCLFGLLKLFNVCLYIYV